MIFGPYSCLIYVLFGPILMENFVCFSNAHTILELMVWNFNLIKLDLLTLLSSDCRAWPQKLSKHLKKQTNHVFVFILPFSTLPLFFPPFLFNFQNFHISTNVIKVVKNKIFQISLTSHETNCLLLLRLLRLLRVAVNYRKNRNIHIFFMTDSDIR